MVWCKFYPIDLSVEFQFKKLTVSSATSVGSRSCAKYWEIFRRGRGIVGKFEQTENFCGWENILFNYEKPTKQELMKQLENAEKISINYSWKKCFTEFNQRRVSDVEPSSFVVAAAETWKINSFSGKSKQNEIKQKPQGKHGRRPRMCANYFLNIQSEIFHLTWSILAGERSANLLTIPQLHFGSPDFTWIGMHVWANRKWCSTVIRGSRQTNKQQATSQSIDRSQVSCQTGHKHWQLTSSR